jgi:hypothetical protein
MCGQRQCPQVTRACTGMCGASRAQSCCRPSPCWATSADRLREAAPEEQGCWRAAARPQTSKKVRSEDFAGVRSVPTLMPSCSMPHFLCAHPPLA